MLTYWINVTNGVRKKKYYDCANDCNWTRTQNHLVRKWKLNHLANIECGFTLKRARDMTRTYRLVQMLLEQSRTFYFLWWNKSNIKEIKTINTPLRLPNKHLSENKLTKTVRCPTEFSPLDGRLAHTQKD